MHFPFPFRTVWAKEAEQRGQSPARALVRPLLALWLMLRNNVLSA